MAAYMHAVTPPSVCVPVTGGHESGNRHHDKCGRHAPRPAAVKGGFALLPNRLIKLPVPEHEPHPREFRADLINRRVCVCLCMYVDGWGGMQGVRFCHRIKGMHTVVCIEHGLSQSDGQAKQKLELPGCITLSD